jgi:hypothetical protein
MEANEPAPQLAINQPGQRVKITKQVLEAVQAGKTVWFIWDTEVEGFGLMVTPSGDKTYILQTRQQRLTLGRDGDVSTDQARAEAIRLAQIDATEGDAGLARDAEEHASTASAAGHIDEAMDRGGHGTTAPVAATRSNGPRWARKERNAPPKWFNETDYDLLRTYDAAEWLRELERCEGLRSGFEDSIAWLSELERRHELPSGIKHPAFIGPPAVQVIKAANQATLHKLEKPALLIQIYLNAPDRVIIEEFKRALKEARRTTPTPVRQRGPKVLEVTFGETHFTKWQTHKIVQICDLDHWRQGLTGPKPTDAVFGEWLFGAYKQPRKEMATARKILNEAISLIPALWAQVEGATPQGAT